jgi:hypothetical protein
MPAVVQSVTKNEVVLEVRVPLGRSMLDNEKAIQTALNEAGTLATGKALEGFDTDGAPMAVGGVRMASRGQLPKEYQTPYGSVVVRRHVYQRGGGGSTTYVPLEHGARIVITSTPFFAKVLSHKYADIPGISRVLADLEQNHGRHVAPGVVQRLADAVATTQFAKEESWTYALPALDAPVASMSVGLDGTCMMLVEDGWREAMVGTISLYDRDGERLHTLYAAASPEYGKETFLTSFAREVERVRAAFPKAPTVGLADGASSPWTFLAKHTDRQTVDFYHVTGYLTDAAAAAFVDAGERQAWLDGACHRLKHEKGAPRALLAELQTFRTRTLPRAEREALEAAITYFENQHPRMTYAENVAKNLPIGSGLTEAACKVIVKERMCVSGGRRWTERGASTVLSLRCLTHTKGRWEQFWAKIDRYGFAA